MTINFQAKNIFLMPEPFTIENKLLTPTMEASRITIRNRYKKELADLYAKEKQYKNQLITSG